MWGFLGAAHTGSWGLEPAYGVGAGRIKSLSATADCGGLLVWT